MSHRSIAWKNACSLSLSLLFAFLPRLATLSSLGCFSSTLTHPSSPPTPREEECLESAAAASELARETSTPERLPTDCERKSVPARARRTRATSAREAGEAIALFGHEGVCVCVRACGGAAVRRGGGALCFLLLLLLLDARGEKSLRGWCASSEAVEFFSVLVKSFFFPASQKFFFSCSRKSEASRTFSRGSSPSFTLPPMAREPSALITRS